MTKNEIITSTLEVTNRDLKQETHEQNTVYDQLNIDQVKSRIYSVRGVEVMLDRELALNRYSPQVVCGMPGVISQI